MSKLLNVNPNPAKTIEGIYFLPGIADERPAPKKNVTETLKAMSTLISALSHMSF